MHIYGGVNQRLTQRILLYCCTGLKESAERGVLYAPKHPGCLQVVKLRHLRTLAQLKNVLSEYPSLR